MKGYPPLFSTTLSSLNLYNEDFRIFVASWWVLWEIYHIFQVNIGILSTVFNNVFLSTFPSLFDFFFQCHNSLYFSWKQGKGKGATRVIKWWQIVRKSPSQQNQPSHKHPSDQLTKAHGDSVSYSQERGEGIRQRTDRYTFFLTLLPHKFKISHKFWFLAVNMEPYSSVLCLTILWYFDVSLLTCIKVPEWHVYILLFPSLIFWPQFLYERPAHCFSLP